MSTSTLVASTSVELTGQLGALADPVRLRIVGLLRPGSQCVCDLRERVPVAANLLSYHLRILREAGLVVATRRGRWVHYRLDAEAFERLWARLGAAGLPMPGQPVPEDGAASRQRRSACDDREM